MCGVGRHLTKHVEQPFIFVQPVLRLILCLAVCLFLPSTSTGRSMGPMAAPSPVSAMAPPPVAQVFGGATARAMPAPGISGTRVH